jgi:hypothetical protein
MGDVDTNDGFLLNNQTITDLQTTNHYHFGNVSGYSCMGDGYFSTGSIAAGQTFTEASFSVWYKTNRTGGMSYGTLISNGAGTAFSQPVLEVSGGYLRLGHHAAATDLNTIMKIAPDTWYHVVATLSTTCAEVYVNGVSKASSSSTYSSGTMNLQFGRRHNNTYYLDGEISKIRVYNMVLSPEDVKREYSGQSVLYKYRNATGYLRFAVADSDFSGGTGNWAASGLTMAVTGGEMTFSSTAQWQYGRLYQSILTHAKAFRVEVNVSAVSGSWQVASQARDWPAIGSACNLTTGLNIICLDPYNYGQTGTK